ncbi:PQQ-binding-like beta-propeller repeat protein [Sphingopyxis granuli]|uniref:outer membrane protein assembly factor BamB family protein n=1 Tax=Sphingopyxis granuli TaxID=267128 RepID=UPI00301D38D5
MRDHNQPRRTRKLSTPTLFAALLGAGSALVAAAVTAQEASSQAAASAQGRTAYAANCAACHGTNLEGGPGGPSLVSDDFRTKWAAQSGEALATYIETTMPPGGGGSLSKPEYVALSTMIREANGIIRAAPKPAAAEPAPAPADVHSGAAAAAAEAAPLVPLARERVDARTAILEKVRPVTDAMLAAPPQGDWLHWRRTYDGQGFSDLTQINRSNVAKLKADWSWQLATGDNEITPLVHDGVIFVMSGGRVDALDAVTGDPLWQYTRPGAGGILRNLAIYEDLIFLAAGTHVVALDMRSGKVAWETQIAPDGVATKVSAGPVVVKGKVLQGMSFCTQPSISGCFIVALDAKTGKEAWRFNTIPKPDEPGGDTWFDTPAEKRAGASVWAAGTYDPKLDLVYFGTGQTYQVTSLLRGSERAPGLYTDTTLALDPDTGKLRWHFQHQDGDVWDMDWSFERIIADVEVDGKMRRTITTGGKNALFDTIDAATGQYLFSSGLDLQTLVKSVDPVTGAKTISEEASPAPGKTTTFCPGTLGGRNWPATAINPRTQVLFIPFNDTCAALAYDMAPAREGGFRTAPDEEGRIGRVHAIDLKTRKTLWTRRERAPQVSAILATDGGLIFEGNRDRWFRASDDRTGKILWQMRLNSSVSSFPISYSVNGVQYVAVVAGGGNFVDMIIGNLAPEIVTPTRQPTLWVFRLPDADAKAKK